MLKRLVNELVADATARHQRRAVDYWNMLRDVVEWWDGLPPGLRQDIEGSGAEPGCIARARRFTLP